MPDALLRSLKGGRLLLAGFLGLLFILLVGRWGVTLYVDVLWFSAQSLADVFLTQLFWEWGARALVGSATAILAWLNLRVAAKTFAGLQLRRRFGDLVIQEQLPASYVRGGIIFGCVFVGFWFATALPDGTGLGAMLLVNAEPWGLADPILGRDLGFYVFVLPVLQGLSTLTLILTMFLGVVSTAAYAATGSISWGENRLVVERLPRLHLGMLAGAFVLFLGLRFYLAPYGLLVEGNSGVQGIFGYADHEARVAAYQMLGLLAMVTAGAVFWGAYRGRLLPIAAGAAALTVGSLALGQVYPSLIQRFQVQPNELDRETPYIEHSVRFTRTGFGLHEMKRSPLTYEVPGPEIWGAVGERLDRLPVWTETTLLTTFRQLEARFQYYDFHEVAFDRYPAGGRLEPVAVSVREVNPAGIPDPNWQNLHLRERYISGMGAVSGQLHRRTDEGRLPMFLTAIPPEYRPGPGVPDELELTRPSVYVGSSPQLYAVINPTDDTFLGPDGLPGSPGLDYPVGIRMGSILRTAGLAWRFQDANLLFSSEVDADSRLVFRRQVGERIQTLAPFLYLPEAPYPVVSDGKIIWIMEGFTLSSFFPLSRSHQIPGRRAVNYLRNSVKATVDAVTGETLLYVTDPADPILNAYRRGFPSLFRDLDEMPEVLRQHLRYSRYLMEAQTAVLTRYHQDDPPVFHGQQDRWALATESSVTSQSPGAGSSGFQDVMYRPEYALLRLPGEARESYVLSTLFVPQGRENLASFLAARWTPGGGSELLLWDAPVEEQIRGPSQIESMIEQDPEISQQFSLWRQGGSQVWTGHLYLVPVGNTLFYMEPIFLAADDNAIPEIQRFVVSDGQRVVMDPSIAGAIAALAAGGAGIVQDVEDSVVESARSDGAANDALDALQRAEDRLRVGDWEGFGEGIEQLRSILTDQVDEGEL